MYAIAFGQIAFERTMKIPWDELRVNFDEHSSHGLVEDWTWLIGEDKTPIMASSIGDLFLSDTDGKVHWLDIGAGVITLVADGVEDFKEKLKDEALVNELFMVDVIAELKATGINLKKGQIYSYKKLPVLGGDYSAENFEAIDMEVHFSFAGQIHRQVKDLPDGTKIGEVKFIPYKD